MDFIQAKRVSQLFCVTTTTVANREVHSVDVVAQEAFKHFKLLLIKSEMKLSDLNEDSSIASTLSNKKAIRSAVTPVHFHFLVLSMA